MICNNAHTAFYRVNELTHELLEISSSGIRPTQPYPESFALKSLSI